MSGFCGFVGKAEEQVIHSMIDSIKHNCEHTATFFSDGWIHLGFVPYVSSENEMVGHNDSFTIWAMIDAGYKREELTPQKVIEAYEEKGISFVSTIEGTFSIVLWDGIRKSLYLIRDRYGAKPLFFAKIRDGIAFGAKIEAILQHSDVNRRVNKHAIYQYLSHQSVFLPHTAFEGVFHISAGSYGVYADGKFEEKIYHNMPFGQVSEDSYEVAVDKIEVLLKKSVDRCTEAENIGVFLSGGLDSGLVTALADAGRIKHSFCLYPATQEDSLHRKAEDVQFSKRLAKEYGIEQHVWEMTAQDLISDVDEILKSFGQPFSGTMSTYFLAKKASVFSKNVLTGDGADELFGSYRHHSVLLPMERYVGYRKRGESIFGKEEEFAPYENNLVLLDNLYQHAGESDTLWYYKLLQMGDGEKSLFLNPDTFGDYIDKKHTLNEIINWDKTLRSKGVLNRSLERDFLHLLPGHTMLYQDTLARNFGINLQMPFLDNALTEYVVILPQEYKMKDGQMKAVLKSVGSKVLPKELVYRRKEPFSLPITEWMKKELKEYVTDILDMDSVKRHGLLNPLSTEYALREFYKNPNQKAYYGQMLWTMAMLERWAFLYM